MGKYDAPFESRSLKDFAVGKLMQTQLDEMLGEKIARPKPFRDHGRYTHIEEKFHDADAGLKAFSASQVAY